MQSCSPTVSRRGGHTLGRGRPSQDGLLHTIAHWFPEDDGDDGSDDDEEDGGDEGTSREEDDGSSDEGGALGSQGYGERGRSMR